MARLGVNIDHIATLREVRKEAYPSLTDAAAIILKNGAHQITMHLREDRRHIQDSDLWQVTKVTQTFKKHLNLEMGCCEEILEIALHLKPQRICLVPEKRMEITTEGGLDLHDRKTFDRVKRATTTLQKNGSKVSLFLEADPTLIDSVKEIRPYAIEIHTGKFAKLFNTNDDYSSEISNFKKIKDNLTMIDLHAGHGLTLDCLREIQRYGIFSEYNIGHAIIADAVFLGLAETIKRYLVAAS